MEEKRVEKIPEKQLEKIIHIQKELDLLGAEFYKISYQLTEVFEKQMLLKQKLSNKTVALHDWLTDVRRKMRLDKIAGYRWQWNGSDSFVGVKTIEKREGVK